MALGRRLLDETDAESYRSALSVVVAHGARRCHWTAWWAGARSSGSVWWRRVSGHTVVAVAKAVDRRVGGFDAQELSIMWRALARAGRDAGVRSGDAALFLPLAKAVQQRAGDFNVR